MVCHFIIILSFYFEYVSIINFKMVFVMKEIMEYFYFNLISTIYLIIQTIEFFIIIFLTKILFHHLLYFIFLLITIN